MITKCSCNIQFDRIHIRGSSHGASRLIRKAYKKSYYMDMVKEAYEMWSTIEEQSGATLHQYVTK